MKRWEITNKTMKDKSTVCVRERERAFWQKAPSVCTINSLLIFSWVPLYICIIGLYFGTVDWFFEHSESDAAFKRKDESCGDASIDYNNILHFMWIERKLYLSQSQMFCCVSCEKQILYYPLLKEKIINYRL
jgi:hypothetical protein